MDIMDLGGGCLDSPPVLDFDISLTTQLELLNAFIPRRLQCYSYSLVRTVAETPGQSKL